MVINKRKGIGGEAGKYLEGIHNLVSPYEANCDGNNDISCFDTANGTILHQKQTKYNNNCNLFFFHIHNSFYLVQKQNPLLYVNHYLQ